MSYIIAGRDWGFPFELLFPSIFGSCGGIWDSCMCGRAKDCGSCSITNFENTQAVSKNELYFRTADAIICS